MAIAKLKKINIFFMRQQLDLILSFLQKNKKIELFDIKNKKIVANELESKIEANYKKNKLENIELENIFNFSMDKHNISNLMNEKAQLLSTLDRTINILEKYNYKKSFAEKFNSKILISASDFNSFLKNEKQIENLLDIANQVNNFARDLENYKSKRTQALENMENIKPWLQINISLDEIFGTYFTRTIAGILSIENYEKFCTTKIEGLNDEVFQVYEINRDKKQVYFLVISYFSETNKLKENISKLGKIIHWEAMENTTSEIYKKEKKYSDCLQKKEKLIIKAIQKRVEYLKDLKIFYDQVYNEWLKLKKNSEIYSINNVSILGGWISEKYLYEFQLQLESQFPETFLIIEDPSPEDDPPIEFENLETIKPFEIVTDLYGRPKYDGIDPTSSLSIFFILFFGICLGDVVYGCIMIFLAIIGKKILKPTQKSIKNALKLVRYAGISTSIVGILTGTFLGNILNFLPKNLNFIKEILNKLQIIDIMDPKGASFFLVVSLAFGYIHLCFALILKAYLHIRDKNYKDLFCDSLPSVFMQICILPICLYYIFEINFVQPFIIKIFLYFFVFSMIIIAANQWISHKKVSEKIFWCLYANYSAITGNFLSDTLSYARLFALGLSGGLLSLAINEISGIVKFAPIIGVFLMILIIMVGHIFSFASSALSAFVHSCRLQYLEFFTKFFESSGREMKPFCAENKYVEIE